MKPDLTPKEAAAIKRLKAAVEALPETLKLTVDDAFNGYPELIIWKDTQPGCSTGVASARCKTV